MSNYDTFDMDGTEHVVVGDDVGDDVGDENCCWGTECTICGGYAHYQPVYGGFYYECEDCHTKIS